MILSAVYAVTRRLVSLRALLLRGDVAKDAELLVLRHENAVLRRHVPRVRYEPAGRLWLAALSYLIPRRRWAQVFTSSPSTSCTSTPSTSHASTPWLRWNTAAAVPPLLGVTANPTAPWTTQAARNSLQDLAFHTVALSMVDIGFAKAQLELLLRRLYLHSNGH